MKKLFTLLLAGIGMSLCTACQKASYANADAKNFAEMTQKRNAVILDVRTAEEFTEAHIKYAINIDVNQDDFIQQAEKVIPKDKPVAVYCRSGRRSANAAEMLAKEGYKVVNLKGGILAWKEQGLPTESHIEE